ncbi:sulfite exporter TauE/SafE family protein [Actinobacillus porcinus]|uniref:sulfite exporter TauE/SafE family protein n=1 Tax=Actinobacillus porcinus TaxID=51048 RepID=UPI002357ECF0|nr:sulfite exporter TauE/SafE family protein [Actinobacillus porcinus]
MMTVFLICLLVGCVVGVLAGLFGIGGGLVIVPVLVYLLPMVGVPDHLLMSVALGSSFATIIITGGASAYNHYKVGNVDWSALRLFAPASMMATYIASFFVSYLPKEIASRIFAVMVVYLAIKMMLSVKMTAGNKPFTDKSALVGGSLIGIASSFAGIGGGSFIVPFLNARGYEMKKAIGSSSFCGMLLAFSGSLSYMVSGWDNAEMPDWSLGSVYLPAVLGITLTSAFTTKFGVMLASQLPVAKLKKAFAIFLLMIACKMILS